MATLSLSSRACMLKLQTFPFNNAISSVNAPSYAINASPWKPQQGTRKIGRRLHRRLSCTASVSTLEGVSSTSGSSASSVPLLSADQVMSKLRDRAHPAWATYKAYYSSILGGIVTDPAVMVLPMDDHIVHRGHGVFDTAIIWDSHLYELDAHLDRFLRSAASARISPSLSRGEMRNILIELAAVSACTQGSLRYWLSAGTGGFGLSPKECVGSTFYAMAIGEKSFPDDTLGVKVVTSTIPIKPPEFATTKTVNYLPNAMVMMEAEEQGAYCGIWLDQEGFIAEGPSMNCAFVSADGYLLVPPFDKILSGCTARRMIALAEAGIAAGGAEVPLKGIRIAPITVAEARAAPEMLVCGSGCLATPVVQWDSMLVGTGKPGPMVKWLRQLLAKDLEAGPEGLRIPIPYK